MKNDPKSAWNLEQLSPFGQLIRSVSSGRHLDVVPTSLLKKWIDEHRFVVLKGFAPLNGTELPEFCSKLGEVLEWEFGAVNNLRVDPEAKNYLYTNRAVPFHWDGAFISRSPHYICFHCDVAPGPQSGGETLFCDTVRLLTHAPFELEKLWEEVVITYTTEKIVHYGGTFSSPLITSHPGIHTRVLRYAEPVHDLNPVQLSITGIPETEQPEFIKDMHRRLNDERCCFKYQWESGDVVIADNHALLHGRRAFTDQTERHIRRVNVL
ncbi:MAG TPA: TauD/TfdA family dioxygenase [Pyrinomonadaceae bacterium]|jgi:alpha-ketoglutarate-dependent taurine dioxygenase|nr:TauD/TfdA family dioxygenase [Pyrinomonadaceae bacterium]